MFYLIPLLIYIYILEPEVSTQVDYLHLRKNLIINE